MFTSRAEHRLLFNHGSAELRLFHHAREHGLVSPFRLSKMVEKKQRIDHWIQEFEKRRAPLGQGTLGDSVRRATTGGGSFPDYPSEFASLSQPIKDEVLYRVSYQGYLAREQRQIEKLSSVERIKIPADIDFLSVRGLRKESAVKLQEFKPYTLGQASRISGVNPADISILMIFIEARRRSESTL
jgi:tRNA uridine 5-carboxymethylaminomethyl modification enzyme